MATITTDQRPLIAEVLFGQIVEQRDLFDKRALIAGVMSRQNTSDSFRVVRESLYPTARDVMEGAEITVSGASYVSTVYIFKKIGYRVGITEEMVDDANWDMMAQLARKAGQAMGVKATRDLVGRMTGTTGVLGYGATGNWATSTSPSGILQDIAVAHRNLVQRFFNPDKMIAHPRLVAYLLRTPEFIHSSKAGDAEGRDALRRGIVGDIYGVQVIPTTYVASDTFIMYDSSIVEHKERWPLRTAPIDDPIRGIQGMVLKQRYWNVIQEPSGVVVVSGA